MLSGRDEISLVPIMQRVSSDTTAGVPSTTSEEGHDRELGDRGYLLVFDARGSSMFPLPASGEVIIGRQAGDLRLEDPAVSRQHARLVIADGVTLVDLESHNGTRVNGDRVIGSRALQAADMITIGGTTLVFHAHRRDEVTKRVLEFSELRRRIDEELERVLRFKRAFGMLCMVVRARGPGLDELLEHHLRKLDICAWVGTDEVVVLLPETGARDTPTAAERLRSAVHALDPGVRIGFTTSPDDGCDADALLGGVRRAALAAEPATCAAAMRAVRKLEIRDRTVVVADVAMVRLYAMIERLASADLPVLFIGETGSGKEIAATAMHVFSPRKNKELVTLNCAAIQETLVESELFGYERGAFSGAVSAKQGLFEVASGGTVFLDEIGELTASTQAKLLRALETKRITRLGDVRERDIDIRLVAATNRDLLEEVDAGRFRRDLYFRLSGAVLWIPPLRERVVELPLLAQRFLDEACRRLGRDAMTISATAVAILRAHYWPGNLRELKNLMDYVAAAFVESIVEPHHITERLRARRESLAPPPPPAPEPDLPSPTARSPQMSLADEIAALEQRRIKEALDAHHGNHAHAARSIGMPLRTFFSKVKKYKLGG